MMPQDLRVPGWYGKIPALGDFASRRLPSPAIASWDRWLQHAMAASRADLGEYWLETYLSAPIWRFAVMPGVIGPTGWAGVVMPSVDKVGRHFPLILTVILDGQQADAALAAQAWYAELERIALSVLRPEFAVAQLEANLVALPFPAPDDDTWSTAQELANWCRDPAPAHAIALPELAALHDIRTTRTQHTLVTHGFGKSLWWTAAESAGRPRLCCFVGLPPEEQFAKLLEGSMLDGSMA